MVYWNKAFGLKIIILFCTFGVEYFSILKNLCECPQLLKMQSYVSLTSKFFISRQILEITAEANCLGICFGDDSAELMTVTRPRGRKTVVAMATCNCSFLSRQKCTLNAQKLSLCKGILKELSCGKTWPLAFALCHRGLRFTGLIRIFSLGH